MDVVNRAASRALFRNASGRITWQHIDMDASTVCIAEFLTGSHDKDQKSATAERYNPTEMPTEEIVERGDGCLACLLILQTAAKALPRGGNILLCSLRIARLKFSLSDISWILLIFRRMKIWPLLGPLHCKPRLRQRSQLGCSRPHLTRRSRHSLQRLDEPGGGFIFGEQLTLHTGPAPNTYYSRRHKSTD